MVFVGVNNLDKPLGFDELQLVAMIHARPYPEPKSESHTNEKFDKNDIPKTLQQRPEDRTRYDRDQEGISFYFESIVRLVCRATSLASKDDDFRAKLEGDELEGDELERAEAFEKQADKVRELELQLEEQVRLQGHSIVMTEAGTELSQAGAEQPENRQAMDLMEEKIELEAQLAELNFPSEDWAEQRLRSTRRKLDDVMRGVQDAIPDVVEGGLAAAMNMGWAVLSVGGAYQLLWRLREERDTLLQHNVIEDASVRKLLFSFLGLKQAYEAGQGEETALTLFATLAKTHHAVGANVVPDTYQAYYVICAQLFGTDKATALLYARLTAEEVSEMEGTALTGVYESDFMHGLDPDDHSWLDKVWSPEALQALHVRRLRGPWGRLYVKELSKLRELQALLEAPLPDVEAYKAIVKKRLDEVRERLGALEATLEHVLPSPSSPREMPASSTAAPTGVVPETNPTTPATAKEAVRNGWWWRRVLQWLSRLRGSLASKLRKLREKLTGKTFNSSASPQDQATETTTAQGIATLRQSLKVAKRKLYTLGTYVKATRTRQELDDWTVDQLESMGLGREGLLCQTLQTLAKSTWDLQDDVAALQSARAPTAKDKLACMLLRVCYIDVPGFLTLAWRDDTGRCERLMKSAFKKSFHLRRNGHTDRVSNKRGLSNEEKGLLGGLCAGMNNAQEWLADHINQPFFASLMGSSD